MRKMTATFLVNLVTANKIMNITCKECGKEHALFKLIGKTKSKTGYYCDMGVKLVSCHGKHETQNGIKFIEFEHDGVVLPTRYTPSAAKAYAKKSQLQFVMTYKNDQDEIEASATAKKMADLFEMKLGINRKIQELMRDEYVISQKAAGLAARLSELQTMRLPGENILDPKP
jgi:hypothetical protein